MNGDFRSDKYLNRMEYYAYDLETDISTTIRGNNQEQVKNQHRFIIDNTAEINPIDWYNAFFEVEFKLVKLADNATNFVDNNTAANMCTMNNGLSLIKEIRVLSEGESVYNNNISANEGANLLTLLNYTKSYADSVGSDQFFYLDTSAAANNQNKSSSTLVSKFVINLRSISISPGKINFFPFKFKSPAILFLPSSFKKLAST